MLLQGRLATLCASLILVNPIAKFALTLEPVAAAATGAAEGVSGGEPGERIMLPQDAVRASMVPGLAYVRLRCAGVSPGVRRFVVRTSLALGALLTARFVPFLGLVMALIGWLHTLRHAS